MATFAEHLGVRVERVDARDAFLAALAGVSDPEEKRKIDAWTNNILRIAQAEPHRVLTSGCEPTGEVNRGLVQLFAMVLREFLEERERDPIEFENLQAFGETYFGTVFADLERIQGEEKLLEG